MTINNTASLIIGLGNGVTTSFNYSFLIPTASDVIVFYTDVAGTVTQLLPSQFSITGVGDADGGTINYPLIGSPIPTGSYVTIVRNIPLVQLTTISNQGAFSPTIIESALDYLMMAIQQVTALVTGELPVPSATLSTIANLRALVAPLVDGVTVFIAGYYVSGDGGGGNYVWSTTASGADNGGTIIQPDSLPSSGRWILSNFAEASALTFGARANGADDSAAINAYMAAMSLLATPGTGYVPVTGLGKEYSIASPVVAGSGIVMRDFALKALAGSWTSLNGMVDINGATNFHAENVFCDANRQSGVNCLYVGSTVDIRLLFCTGCRWTGSGSGVYLNGGKADIVVCNLRQWFNSDPEALITADRSGASLLCTGAADSTITGGNIAVSLDPFSCDFNSHHLSFIAVHFFNGLTGVVYANARNGTIAGWAIKLIGCYFDTGYFLLPVTASTPNGPSPDIEVVGCVGLYNGAVATYGAWFQLTTSVANSNINSLRIAENRLTGGISQVSFAATGAGSWGTVPTSDLTAVTGDMNINGSGLVVYPRVKGLGDTVFTGILFDNVAKGNDYTFTNADSHKVFFLNNGGSARTLTLPNTMPEGWIIKVYPSGAGAVTVVLGAGGTINGSAANRVFTQNAPCELVCYHNSNGLSAVFGAIGTIT